MDIFAIILLLLAVTYIPRAAPFYLVSTESIPPVLKRFLTYIPYAALGALIMPGSIDAVSGRPLISALEIIFAGIVAWFNSNIIAAVFLSVAATFLILLLF